MLALDPPEKADHTITSFYKIVPDKTGNNNQQRGTILFSGDPKEVKPRPMAIPYIAISLHQKEQQSSRVQLENDDLKTVSSLNKSSIGPHAIMVLTGNSDLSHKDHFL